MPEQKTGLVITAHPGDFVWRAGGAIALHAKRGYRVKIVCLSYGERGESQFAWKEPGATLEKVKAGRKDEAERAAGLLGAEIEFFDCGDYPLKLSEQHFDRTVDIYRELNPSFVLSHALEDLYNFDHPERRAFRAGNARGGAGHGPQAGRQVQIFGAADVPVRAAPAGDVQLQTRPHPQDRRGVGAEVQGLPDPGGAEALWGYYERVALNRGIQGSRNTGVPMTYGEAYQTLFPRVAETLG